jgi:hypothetical protein
VKYGRKSKSIKLILMPMLAGSRVVKGTIDLSERAESLAAVVHRSDLG